ncbi:MAG TPA: cytochrome c [Vicinamibacterales bacterium]|nr:cytochrome c [Vicinamibacterales bacterium]
MSHRLGGGRAWRGAMLAACLGLTVIMAGTAGGDAKALAAPVPPATVYRDVYNGWKWWHVYCYRCHGVNAIGGALAPNLIGANQKFTRAEFIKIVREGREDKGMQSWKALLTDAQIGQIQLYVRARKEKVLPAGRPDELGPNKTKWAPPAGWPKT